MILHLPLLEKALDDLRAGRRVALCAVVKTRGSTPQSAGAMLIIDEGMNSTGTLGGGCVEAEIRKQAFALLASQESKLLSFQLDHDYGWDDGLICGGGMDVAVTPLMAELDAERLSGVIDAVKGGRPSRLVMRVEREGSVCDYSVLIEAEPKLLIAGAGHIGTALARLCVELEFDVTVIDDRGDFANASRLPPPIHAVVGDIEHTLRKSTLDANTYVVIVTRGHNHDEQALSAVVDSNAKYIGMIGSRRKVKLIFDDLIAAGVAAKSLERVHAPIGLEINAVTVPEIALSIAGQLIAARRQEKAKLVEGPVPVTADSSP